mmetsp:Transcript_8428/g.12846  ORF Transcript_8428/g.12846 Transcript_8428/m.12846 type:complete len:141 (+) Transcript_8428:1829-2251(+)
MFKISDVFEPSLPEGSDEGDLAKKPNVSLELSKQQRQLFLKEQMEGNTRILQFCVDLVRSANPKEVQSQNIDGRFCKIIRSRSDGNGTPVMSVILQFSSKRQVESVYIGPVSPQGLAQTLAAPPGDKSDDSSLVKGLMIF